MGDVDILIEELEGIRKAKAALVEREDALVKAIWVVRFPDTKIGKVLCNSALLHKICSFNSLQETYRMGLSTSLLLRCLVDSNGAWPVYQVDSSTVPLEPLNVYLNHLSVLRVMSPLERWLMKLLRKSADQGFKNLTSVYIMEPLDEIMDVLVYATFLTTISYKGEFSLPFHRLLTNNASTVTTLSLSLTGCSPQCYYLPFMKNLILLDLVDGPFEVTPEQLRNVLESSKLECLYLGGILLVEKKDSNEVRPRPMSCAEFVKICLESEKFMEVVLQWSDIDCLNQLGGEGPLFLTLMNLRGSTLSHWRWFRLTKTGVMAFQYGDPPEFAEKMFLQQYEGVKDWESLLRAEIQLDFPEDFYQYVSDEVREILDQIALRIMMVLADRSTDVASLQDTPPLHRRRSSVSVRESIGSRYAFSVVTDSTRASSDGHFSSP